MDKHNSESSAAPGDHQESTPAADKATGTSIGTHPSARPVRDAPVSQQLQMFVRTVEPDTLLR
ncbi:hypothetical protein J0H33_16665, partial [bacterium]|nr:hypothetical protein [bacterium]